MVRTLEQGAHFGEIAILKNVRRTLSVKASSDSVKLLVLSKEAFERILGSIRDYLKEDYKSDPQSLDASFESEGNKRRIKSVLSGELVKIPEQVEVEAE